MARRAPRAAQGRALATALACAAACGACGGGDSGPGGTLVVAVAYHGADPDAVEQAVLAPLEQALAGVKGLHGLRGHAREGGATVEVTFRRGVDTQSAAGAVRDALTAVQQELPVEAEPPVVAVRPAASVLARIADQPQRFDELAIRLGSLPIAGIDQCGVREARLALDLVPAKLAAYGLTVAEVSRALAATNVDVPAGRVDARGGDVLVRARGGAASYDAIADVVVVQHGGAPVRVRDVAVITQRAEATCLVDGQDPGAKDRPALVRVGLRHPKDAPAVEKELRKAGLEPLRGAITVSRPGRPTRVELVPAPVGPVLEALLVGDDARALAEAGGAAVVAAREAAGVADAWCEGCALSTTQQVEVDRARAAELGVSPVDVAQVLHAAFAGEAVATYEDGRERIDVVVGIEEGGTRWSELTVRRATGELVPLHVLVTVREASAPADVLHVDRRRAVALRLRGAPKTTVAALKKVAASVLPGARVRALDPVAVDATGW